MTASSEAMVEFFWVWPRWMFSFTACASSAVPSVKVRPGRRVKVTALPESAYFHEEARPGPGLPAGSRVVIEAYTRPRTCMSQPALEVTGSHDVGSCHSQLMVPVAPAFGWFADEVPGDELLAQAAAPSDTARVAASSAVRRAARKRIRMDGLLEGGTHRHVVVGACTTALRLIRIKSIGQVGF